MDDLPYNGLSHKMVELQLQEDIPLDLGTGKLEMVRAGTNVRIPFLPRNFTLFGARPEYDDILDHPVWGDLIGEGRVKVVSRK